MQGALQNGRITSFLGGTVPTPIAVLRTSSGSLCYTSIDLQESIPGTYLGQFDIGDYLNKPVGIHQLMKRPKYSHHQSDNNSSSNTTASASTSSMVHFEGILSARQMDFNLSNPNPKGVRVTTNSGQRLVTVEDLVKRVSMDQPKFVVALADEVPYHLSTPKRLETSTRRSLEWFKQLREQLKLSSNDNNRSNGSSIGGNAGNDYHPFVFGVALPYYVVAEVKAEAGDNKSSNHSSAASARGNKADHAALHHKAAAKGEQQLRANVEHLLSSGCHGICVGGLGLGEDPEIRRRAIASVRRIVDTITRDNKPTTSSTTSNANDIGDGNGTEVDAAAMECRDSTACTAPAACTPVPVLVQGMNSLEEILHSVAAGADLVSTNLPSSATKLGHSIHWGDLHRAQSSNCSSNSGSSGGTGGNGGMINLWDKQYTEDRRPLMEGCTCHACKHHTRQYVHHLLLAHELLGEVLLYNHNQHQVIQLFEIIRHKIRQPEADSAEGADGHDCTTAEFRAWLQQVLG